MPPRRRATRRNAAPPFPRGPAADAPLSAPAPAAAPARAPVVAGRVAPGAARPASMRASAAMSRPARLVAREMPYLRTELRRIAGVTATCIGLLAVLAVVDRLS